MDLGPDFAVNLARQAILIAFLIASPMLVFGLIIGLIISIFQAVTQINEMTLTFVPKIVVVSIVLIVFAPWMLNLIVDFTSNMLINLPNYIK